MGMLTRKITNRVKQLYCSSASDRQSNILSVPEKLVVTTFYDVEGDYAIQNMTQPCFRALTKIVELEESLGIKSTYNIVAKFAEEAPQLFRDIENAGHEIASHSYNHKVLTSLNARECRDNIYNTRKAFDSMGLSVKGHRSPQSMWNLNVLKALYDTGFTWNAENGRADIPFHLPVSLVHKNESLWRLPISIDDWAYEGRAAKPEEVLDMWKLYVSKKLEEGGGYLAIGFHPWVEEPVDRYEVFSEFMKWLSLNEDIVIMPFGEVINNIA